jgi:hypothetical protein
MRYLILLLPLLCGCASYNEAHGLQCAPAYSPGTPAYKACLMRNAETGDEGYAHELYDYSAD